MPGFTTGAATFAAKVSDAASPLVSVAVTLTIRFCMVTGAVPLNVLLVGLKVSQPGSAFPFDWVAVYRNVCACGSVNVFAGSAKKTGLPSCQICFGVWAVSVGFPSIVAVNVSVADNALASVAVTLMVKLWAVDGAVPVKVSVFA